MIAGSVELEAGLEGHAPQRRTDRLALDFQRARRQRSRALRTRTAKPNGAADRAVTVNAPDGLRTFKTANFEQLADDEATGLPKAHLFGGRRSSHDEPNQQKRPTCKHPVPLFPPRQCSLILYSLSLSPLKCLPSCEHG